MALESTPPGRKRTPRSPGAWRPTLLFLTALSACGAGEPEVAVPEWPVVLDPGAARPARFERLVLVTIDTLRADHLSCYGYPRQTTPFLDSLAERGVRFTRALAAISHTAPSHATMLTGLVPAVHGVLENGQVLDPAALDLARLASEHESAAFLNANFLRGVAGSFGHVEVRGAGGAKPQNGGAVVDAALAWLAKERRTPRFFLWVHLYDPHEWQVTAYAKWDQGPLWSGSTPPGFLEQVLALHGLPPLRENVPYTVDWGDDRREGQRVRENGIDALQRCIDQYDELILFADRQVARLYQGIEALGLSGATLWVVTADHGEGLASHATTGHGGQIYQEQIHVPLLVHASDGSLGPRVVDDLVAHIDLLPTLAEALGKGVRGDPRVYEGRSLWPLVEGGAGHFGARPLFSQRRPLKPGEEAGAAEMYALQTAEGKLILNRPGREEFYDLARDPAELHDLGGDHPQADALRAGLEERLRVYRGVSASGPAAEVSEEWLEELRDLGYVR